MRIGFTIIFNGLHHLQHNNYVNYLLNEVLDYWIIVEGASGSEGSTKWCKGDNSEFHKNGSSIDGTAQFLIQLQQKNPNLILVFPKNGKSWNSKDEMVNEAIKEIKKITHSCILWEIDVDEQWNLQDIIENENYLKDNNAKTGLAKFNQYVGKNLIAVGPNWGGNTMARLWNWKGETFEKHEPPTLVGGNGKEIILPKIYQHYSYYFPQDVEFKSKWYYNDINIFNNWKKLQNEKVFPQQLEYFMGDRYKGSEIKRIEINELVYKRKYYLLQPFFIHSLESRNNEFKKSLLENLKNEYIKTIYLFFENFKEIYYSIYPYINNRRIKIIDVHSRQTYKMIIDFCNKYLNNEICIVANTDIWFDSTLKILEKINLDNKILCLTRYNNISNYSLHDDSGASHDTWIFRSPLRKFDYDIQMGILGCDSLFHIRAKALEIKLLNCCYDIKSYHEHSDISHESHTRNNRLKDRNYYGKFDDWSDFRLKPEKLK